MLCGIEPAEVSPVVLQFGVDNYVLDVFGGNMNVNDCPMLTAVLKPSTFNPFTTMSKLLVPKVKPVLGTSDGAVLLVATRSKSFSV